MYDLNASNKRKKLFRITGFGISVVGALTICLACYVIPPVALLVSCAVVGVACNRATRRLDNDIVYKIISFIYSLVLLLESLVI